MTVLNSGISWCTGTLNLTVGCTKVSAACDHCYAEALVNRNILPGGGDFAKLQFHANRIRDLRKFAPARNAADEIEPKMVFVNSLSDFWHDQIPTDFIHAALDRFEEHPQVIIQILTKRPVRMRRLLVERYGNRGIPRHFWIGVSAEDNRVAARLNFLRRLKDQVGDFTAFTSVEPIIAPCDELDFDGIDWVLTGGESGPKARPMRFEWLEQANEKALGAGIPLHFKQYGTLANNPLVVQILAGKTRIGSQKISATGALMLAIKRGDESCGLNEKGHPREKGGATYKGRMVQEKPARWHQLKAELNRRAA